MQKTLEKKDRRSVASRNPTEAVVVCRPFTSSGATHTADGFMRNFSKEGSYIETSREFKLGTILHLRIVRYPSMRLTPGTEDQPRSICLAEVKWRKELADENATRYGIGLRYLD
jgi:hypothetical protein